MVAASVSAWWGAQRAPAEHRLVGRLIATGISLTAVGDGLWEMLDGDGPGQRRVRRGSVLVRVLRRPQCRPARRSPPQRRGPARPGLHPRCDHDRGRQRLVPVERRGRHDRARPEPGSPRARGLGVVPDRRRGAARAGGPGAHEPRRCAPP